MRKVCVLACWINSWMKMEIVNTASCLLIVFFCETKRQKWKMVLPRLGSFSRLSPMASLHSTPQYRQHRTRYKSGKSSLYSPVLTSNEVTHKYRIPQLQVFTLLPSEECSPYRQHSIAAVHGTHMIPTW